MWRFRTLQQQCETRHVAESRRNSFSASFGYGQLIQAQLYNQPLNRPSGSFATSVGTHEDEQAGQERSRKATRLTRKLSRCTQIPLRRMPIALPHEVVPMLLQDGILQYSAEMRSEIDFYWRFLAARHFPGSEGKVGSGCIPLWLWGDDAQYNERQQKIVTIAFGAVLDSRTSSMEVTYPLAVFQVDPRHVLGACV